EEQKPETVRKVPSGYPRFHVHPYVARLREHVRAAHGLGEGPLLLVPSERAARELCAYAGVPAETTPVEGGLLAVLPSPDPAAETRARAFQQHSGCIVSSRRAESLLLRAGLLRSRWEEEHDPGDAAGHARGALAAAYGAAAADVHLAVTGMNAIYRLYCSL